MAKKNKKTSEIEKDIISKMKDLGIYNKSYLHSIEVLAKSLHDHEKVLEQFEEEGSEYVIEFVNKNGSVNKVRNPLYITLEALRNSIYSYSKQLGLLPKSSQSLVQITESKLDKWLKEN